MPGVLGGTSVVGIALIARGVALLRSVRRVVVDDQGLRVDGFISSQQLRWDQVFAVREEKKSQLLGNTIKQFVLLNDRERPLAAIPEHIEGFEELKKDIEAKSSAARGSPTFDPETQRRSEIAKSRKGQKKTAALSAVMGLLFATMFGVGVFETLHLRRYASEGIKTAARIDRRYMVRVTPRISYHFQDASGHTFERETGMDEPAWNLLEGSNTVDIEYLPSNPEWNRLVNGEEAGPSFGGKFLFLSGFLTLFMGAIFVSAVLGWDLRAGEGGGLKLVRWGEESRPPAVSPAMPQVPVTVHLPAISVEPARPVGLTVLGALAILLAVLGGLRAAVSLVLTMRGSMTLGDQLLEMDDSVFHYALMITDGLAAILLLVSGIGLIMLHRWSRGLAIVVAVMQLLSSVATIAYMMVNAAQAPELPGELGMRQATSVIAGVIGQLISTIFPIVLLAICARRSTAEALARAEADRRWRAALAPT
jgi:hypothetical protein